MGAAETPRPPAGTVVEGEVTRHEVYGLIVKVPGVEDAVVDVIETIDLDDPSETRRAPDDWPPVGTRTQAVVLGYMPEGQMRLSLRRSAFARPSNFAKPS